MSGWDTANSIKPMNCPYCGMLHERTVCPLVAAFEYHPNGTLKRVEFKHAQIDWANLDREPRLKFEQT